VVAAYDRTFLREIFMIRRSFLIATAGVVVAPIAQSQQQPLPVVHAFPDARFVGFAETVNSFEIQSGNLALSKSQNELVRAFARRSIDEYTLNEQNLVRNRNEAGVTMAPDEEVKKIADDAMARLNSLSGVDFDNAYADAQLRVQTAASAQYGAYSQNGNDGSLRRHAERMWPQIKEMLEASKRLSGSR
jgi:putative membrane protein